MKKIQKAVVGLVHPESEHTGYTNAVRAVAGRYMHDVDQLITGLDHGREAKDLGEINFNGRALSNLRDMVELIYKPIDIVAAGYVGLKFLTEVVASDVEIRYAYTYGRLRFVYTSEQFYDVPLAPFSHGLIMLVPECAKYKYTVANPSVADKINFGIIDYMAAEPREVLEEKADAFIEANTDNGNEDKKNSMAFEFSDMEPKLFAMLGGRMKESDGSTVNNTAKEFAEFAERVAAAADGGNIVVTTHGTRSFTHVCPKGNVIQDTEPFEEGFLPALRHLLAPGQKAFVFGKKAYGENALYILDGPDKYLFKYNGNQHQALVRFAAQEGLKVLATGDQALAVAEHLAFGGKPENFRYDAWGINSLEGDANARAMNSKIARGLPLKDAGEALIEAVSTRRQIQEAFGKKVHRLLVRDLVK